MTMDQPNIHTPSALKDTCKLEKKGGRNSQKLFILFYLVDGFGVILSIFLCIQFILHSNTFKWDHFLVSFYLASLRTSFVALAAGYSQFCCCWCGCFYFVFLLPYWKMKTAKLFHSHFTPLVLQDLEHSFFVVFVVVL